MNASQHTPFTMLVDGMCPVCMHEVRMLRRLDRGRGRLAFIDIAAPDFDPLVYARTQEEVMGEIHGVLPDGTLITGMGVFRRAYAAVGWGWLWAPTGWRLLKPLFDAFYRVFARNRVRWFRKSGCETGTCKVPGANPPPAEVRR